MPTDGLCRCGSGDAYAACCGPLHSGERVAGTALALMRSRFTAFALGDADYLLATWHTGTSPGRLELDETVTWRRLQIVDIESGGERDSTGVVEFRAQYEVDGQRHILHERSRFVRGDGDGWRYVDGDMTD